MTATVVIGAQWGDEGKGKIVDLLAQKYDAVARYQGGHNAGHTIVVDGKTHALHLIPSGVLNPHAINVVGNGVVLSPESIIKEMVQFENLEGRLYRNKWVRCSVAGKAGGGRFYRIDSGGDTAGQAERKRQKDSSTTCEGGGPKVRTRGYPAGIDPGGGCHLGNKSRLS